MAHSLSSEDFETIRLFLDLAGVPQQSEGPFEYDDLERLRNKPSDLVRLIEQFDEEIKAKSQLFEEVYTMELISKDDALLTSLS